MDPAWLEALARSVGRGATMRRLTRSLEVDPSAAQADLGWEAQVGLERAAHEMVHGEREERCK
jgi:nucleoside-diphosphate-sugar epimerase